MTKNNQDQDESFEKYKDLLGNSEAFKECEACGGSLELEKVNLEDYQGGRLYMMENVPAYVCQDCAEIWVPEPIMEEFEKMIETVKQKKKTAQKAKAKKKGEKDGNK
jgi:YgiT-type zinc finger domain-containing protein